MSSCSKNSLPYKVDQEYDIIHILGERHEIPYHSRPFMWTEEEYIGYVTREILEDWRKALPHWLGIVILYTGGAIPSVSDAQHRLTICFLVILALTQLLENDEPLKLISKYGSDSLLDIEPSDEDSEILDKYGWTRYPNIVSCFDYDFEALGNLLNKKERPRCVDSKIYSGFDVVYKILKASLSEDTKTKCTSLLRYITKDVRVLRISISDWQFAMKVFNSFNNIKVAVPPSYLLRNALASVVGESHSEEIHELFISIEKMDRKNYEINISRFVNLFANRILENDYSQEIEQEIRSYKGNPIVAFREIFHQSRTIMDLFKQDRFGRILHSLSSGHEVIGFCVLPFGFVMLKQNKMNLFKTLLTQLICYGIRKGKVCFNPIKLQTTLKGLVADLLNGRKTLEVSLSTLQSHLIEWLEENKNNELFIQNLSSESFKGNSFNRRARPLMLFLTEITDTFESRLDHEATDIDHIYPKKPMTNGNLLVNMDMRFTIGNFTPFISKNKEGIKGNKSLGNKAFKNKIEEYKKSNLAMTRHVAERYALTDFKDEQIRERSLEIAKLFASITAKELQLNF